MTLRHTPVIWLPQAQAELSDIHAYIARVSRGNADRFCEQILMATMDLEVHPDIGRVVPEVGRSEIREIFHGRYRIVYHRSAEAVQILTVFHGSRLFRHLDDRSTPC